MATESRHISDWIGLPADDVYDYASDPANLPRWAPGLGSSVKNSAGQWLVQASMGRVGSGIGSPWGLSAPVVGSMLSAVTWCLVPTTPPIPDAPSLDAT